MSATTFTRRMDAHSRCVLNAEADLSGGRYVTVNAARTGMVELGLFFSADLASHQSLMAFTPEQARAVAAELVACADAYAPGAGVALKGGVQ
ncbi:hypothetical protein N5J23_08150 [Comamonas aquatica]|uniref:Uncharacterized protein n=1 Tax=Comamonas aquatica TaxID=225991 RepID=A0AA42HQ17_9BURK|nr:hypothetical protein [Comamonas aquatica]MDH0362532.1 hypothetical protein [Comamonas aquatica]MDH1427035.1 hypothetical protein [Comamonas aquatica]MDH1605592.1 hypothetical protein [Comamonas aquatica]MDH1617548.1 hypothetical protein [Comamonas aquatica]MDH2005516.1 hypothetical protein [Comamonas aquatica]